MSDRNQAARCPICGDRVPASELRAHIRADSGEIERYILNAIRRNHPEWVASDGTCRKCWEYYCSLGELATATA